MKRSEAIQHLAQVFLDRQGVTTPKKIAEAMLRKMEEVGMLPPNAYPNCGDGSIDDYTWENENEQAD